MTDRGAHALEHGLGGAGGGDEAVELGGRGRHAWLGRVIALHSALGAGAPHVDLHEPPLRQVVGDPEGHRQPDPVVALDLLERGGVALEDALPLFGHLEALQDHPGDAVPLGAPTVPSSQSCSRRASDPTRPRASWWPGPTTMAIWYFRNVCEVRSPAVNASLGPIAMSTARVVTSETQLAGGSHAQLHVEILGPAREELDEAGRGVLGEQAGGGQPQQPAALARGADLADGLVLQAEHLRRPAGQPQAAGGEGDARRRCA